jgi:hypothetical protein
LTKFLTLLDKFLDNFLHLPTLMVLALVGIIVLWGLYEVNLDWDDSFVRLSTNRGTINLYWHEGCCDLSW